MSEADPWDGFTGESAEERGYAEGWKDGRAEVADMKARLAETEAIIEKAADKYLDRDVFDAARLMYDILQSSHRPSVLEAHDREVAARALDAVADEGEALMFGAGYEKPADDDWDVAPRWHEIRRLRARAAALRSGSEGNEQ